MVKAKSSKKASKSKPIGATIVAIYFLIVGIFALVASVMFLTVGPTVMGMLFQGPLFSLMSAAIGIVALIAAIIYLIVGYGIWKLKKWAQIVATVLSVLGLFGGPLSLVLSIVVILLLWVHKDTKKAFS
ncbi:hypothetical protein J4471_06090 [Candidatus Woesearchaeota archaeon]|nr:hypothetical protein [Candidatus Woesearchaeota archaeon]